MNQLRGMIAFRFGLAAVALTAAVAACARAEWPEGHGGNRRLPPVYQRRAFEWMHQPGHWQGHGRASAPQVSAGWFQRPYPYHLDYYRMRYGGSYAPYFGNLYGPPKVVTAPPYYGPYYGDFGGYGDGMPGAYPPQPSGAMYQDGASPQPGTEPNDERLPAPEP